MVSLVNHDVCARPQFAKEGLNLFSRGQTGGRIVWIADVNETSGGVDACTHALKVMNKLPIEGHSNNLSPYGAGIVLHSFKGWHGQDDFSGRAQKSDGSRPKQLRRAASQQYLFWINPMKVGDCIQQPIIFPTRVTVAGRNRTTYCVSYLRRGSISVLIPVETDEVTLPCHLRGFDPGASSAIGKKRLRIRQTQNGADAERLKERSCRKRHGRPRLVRIICTDHSMRS